MYLYILYMYIRYIFIYILSVYVSIYSIYVYQIYLYIYLYYQFMYLSIHLHWPLTQRVFQEWNILQMNTISKPYSFSFATKWYKLFFVIAQTP